MMETAEQIKTWAREIGFDKVGVAAAEPLPEGGHLRQWLDRGYNGGMSWLAKNIERRLDPCRVLPGARSIICLAVDYFVPVECGPDYLKISRYARGADYHDVLGKMLKNLVIRIADARPESRNLWYVDAGPIMEKTWAQRAGLGCKCKNDLLVTRDYGTWVFLGEIISTLELPPDMPESDHCGNCTKCMEACPNGAIVEPRVLDTRRCITYWTNKHEGDFPPEIAAKLHGWVYGCDICQEVCPFNHKRKTAARTEEFAPRAGILQAEQWRGIDETRFVQITHGGPLQRAGYARIRRNLQAAGVIKG